MERMGGMLRAVLRQLKDARGVSLYEITAAVAMTGILAAVAVPVIIEKTTEAKAARVTQETDAISQAINGFKRDTGKTPGEAEGILVLLTGPQGMHALLPNAAGAAFNVPGVSMDDSSHTCSSGCANMNDYLVRDPNLVFPGTNGSVKYPNWKGPYIDELFIDQFDRSYMVNVAPMYRQENPPPPGSCGFAWVLSGGPDRNLETNVKETNVKPSTDDIGKNNGKRLGSGRGCTTATTE
jgi:type II secretory pathway pseudopilin PulG